MKKTIGDVAFYFFKIVVMSAGVLGLIACFAIILLASKVKWFFDLLRYIEFEYIFPTFIMLILLAVLAITLIMGAYVYVNCIFDGTFNYMLESIGKSFRGDSKTNRR